MKTKCGFASVIVPIAVGLVVSSVVAYYLFKTNNTPIQKRLTQKVQEIVHVPTASPEPTSFLFQELTIPYLRNREYKSSLSELNIYSDNDSYTSYLTSYDSDGFRVDGLLTVPKGETPKNGWPAIVFVHGYIPPTLYKTTERYNDYVNYLAKNGFVVFKIDLRGHGDSEGEAYGAYYDGEYVIDTLNARAALSDSNFVNKDKIGLWGHSMAGNVVFRSFVAAQNIPAVVIWAGAVYTYEDLSEFRISDNSYRPPTDDSDRRKRRDKLNETYGSFDPESDFWKQVVPTNYLSGVNGAIEINHAVDDTVVNIGYSRNLMKILDGTDITHELFEYQSGGHNLAGESFTKAMQRTVEFYQRKL